ncbi:hypothetical protein BDZ89DRAFT_174931 [Hymenopellis radicata]|nr:hypothetical protein BDZ89DRAFT_174931 [Hymenopellis radicata]
MSQLTNDDSATAAAVTDDPEFNAADADVCIISSDNVRFKVHSTNLGTHSSVFPAVHGAANDVADPARMAECAEVLRVIFKFIYPDPPLPKLGLLSFSTLEEVAMAADKYQFLALSELCDCHMEKHANTHPAEVLSL